MKKTIILLMMFIACFCFNSCNNDDKDAILTMKVASKIGKGAVFMGPPEAVQPILWIKYGQYPGWQGIGINEIDGFNYEEGYEYMISVKVVQIENPPADGSSEKYYFIKTISKEKKNSEDLPADYIPPTGK